MIIDIFLIMLLIFADAYLLRSIIKISNLNGERKILNKINKKIGVTN